METEARWRAKPRTTFSALRGSEDSDQLMVIGRAVNGWTSKWNFGGARAPEARLRILSRVFVAKERNDERPMLWVTDQWKAYQGYKTKNSASWRLARATVDRLGIADVSNRTWPLTLCWSNLYKVAHFAGGNPSESLARAKLEKCI